MKKIAIVTDSNSGISQAQAEEMGIFVLPMPFYINGELYYEGINLSVEEFYAHLSEDAEISTSQPAPGDVMDLWDKILKEYEEIVYIPMSSGLSSSCETAIMLSQDYDGKVQVVDNQRISVTMRQSVLDALTLAAQGKTAAEIKEVLEATKLDSSIYLMVNSLKYLKKGGRITPAAAAIGSILNIKPVLQIQGDKLDAFAKVRGVKAGKKAIIEAMKKDVEERFADFAAAGELAMQTVFTGISKEEEEEWMSELHAAFPGVEFYKDKLSLSVACHIGPDVFAVACARIIK